jgi:heme-degrading monooxygenase HmoA
MSVTAVVRHKVADYDAWRTVYDSLAEVQASGGVTAESVHRLLDDGNDVLVVHRFDTADAAQAFLSSEELREGMHKAGVQGPPRIEIYEDA